MYFLYYKPLNYKEILNSDAPEYDGSGVQNTSVIQSESYNIHGHTHTHCLKLNLPPLAGIILKPKN